MASELFVNPKKPTRDEVRDYLNRVMVAENSGEPFPIDMDDVWQIAYASKQVAKRALVDSGTFREGVHYTLNRNVECSRPRQFRGLQPREEIKLSVKCFEFFIATQIESIFEVYHDCRKFVTDLAQGKIQLPNQPHPWHDRIEQTITPHMRLMAERHIGRFSVFSAIAPQMMQMADVLEEHFLPLLATDKPDGSAGTCYANFRDASGIDAPTGFADLYVPILGKDGQRDYRKTQRVRVTTYPMEEHAGFIRWFFGVYVPEKMPEYYLNKSNWKKIGIRVKASAANQTSLRMIHRNASFKNERLPRILADAGGPITMNHPDADKPLPLSLQPYIKPGHGQGSLFDV